MGRHKRNCSLARNIDLTGGRALRAHSRPDMARPAPPEPSRGIALIHRTPSLTY